MNPPYRVTERTPEHVWERMALISLQIFLMETGPSKKEFSVDPTFGSGETTVKRSRKSMAVGVRSGSHPTTKNNKNLL